MDKENQTSENTITQNDKWKYKDLPEYVQELLKKPGFETLFLMKNPRYLTKGFIEFLPDFGTKEKDKEYWHGKLFWRFVGWNINKKYTGADLREIRKKNGVGHNKRKVSHVEDQGEKESTLSG